MKKFYFLLLFVQAAFLLHAQVSVGTQADLEKVFAQGDYDFAAELADGGGDLWYADGWGNSVLTADFNGDGNKDVFVMGRVSFGEVENATPQNILYLGNGEGQFTPYQLPADGAFYLGYAHYIKVDKDRTIIGATGCITDADWWSPMFDLGKKYMFKSSLHELSFDAEGKPVWTLVANLDDGSCGAGASVNLYDFNNDGNYDVLISGVIGLPDTEAQILSEYGAATQVLYLGDGNGNFTRKTHVETGLWPVQDGGAVVADFNGDGILDVASVMSKSGNCWNDAGNVDKKAYGSGVYVSIGKGDGTFDSKCLVKSEREGNHMFVSEGARVQVIDINEDGHPDIWYGLNDQVSTDPWRYRGGFLLNDGAGNFTPHNKTLAGTDFTPLGVERATPLVGDFNQDGHADMWYNSWLPTDNLDDPNAGNNLCALVGVLITGNGEGGFQTQVFKGENGQGEQALTGYHKRFASLKSSTYAGADFNGDGVMDIVAISGDAHNSNFKGITYMKGTAAHSDTAMPLPEDNALKSATAIERVTTSRHDDGRMYNLQGQRVTSVSAKGIYIVGGRKVVEALR